MKQDKVEWYLKKYAHRETVTDKFISQYKELHSSREKYLREYVSKHSHDPMFKYNIEHYTYKHGSAPFCKLCDKDLVVDEEIYLFYVGGGDKRCIVPYHVDCTLSGVVGTWVINIVRQDTAYRGGLVEEWD